MTWKQLTERDSREWMLSAIDPHDRDLEIWCKICHACSKPVNWKGTTVMDIAPVPARSQKSDDDNDDVQFYRFDKEDSTTDIQCTAITDRYSDTTIFQLRVHWVRVSWSIGSEKIVRTCAAGGSRTLDSLRERQKPSQLDQAFRATTLCQLNTR